MSISQLSNLYLYLRYDKQAVRVLEIGYNLGSTDSNILMNLVAAYTGIGRYDKAIELGDKLLALHTRDYVCLDACIASIHRVCLFLLCH